MGPHEDPVQLDYKGVHITVSQNGNLDYIATFVKGDMVERHELHPALHDIRVAVEHAKALLDD